MYTFLQNIQNFTKYTKIRGKGTNILSNYDSKNLSIHFEHFFININIIYIFLKGFKTKIISLYRDNRLKGIKNKIKAFS
jgi:hypothetical protein